MAKSLQRLEARKLRNSGLSMRDIAKKLKVSRSSVSYWVKDIILTEEQLFILRQSELNGHEKGRLKTALIKKERRQNIVEGYKKLGILRIPNLNRRELLLVGLALYWAEGSKSGQNRRVEFCNSDPTMIKLFIEWSINCFGVRPQDLKVVVGINEIHAFREEQVKKYWSDTLGISFEQFRKTSFKKVKSRKIYDNLDDHFGTLTVLVTKSTELYYKIMGLIHGLYLAKINPLAA